MTEYLQRVPVGPLDQFVVGVNPRSLVEVGRVILGAQILTRSGPDGADSVLTETTASTCISSVSLSARETATSAIWSRG